MSQLLGKALIKADGELLETLPGAKLDMGGVTRTPHAHDTGNVHFAEQTKEAMVECEVSVTPGLSLDKFRKMTDVTIQFLADTGQSYIVRNAFCVDPPVVTAGEGGKVPLKFAGPAAEEVL